MQNFLGQKCTVVTAERTRTEKRTNDARNEIDIDATTSRFRYLGAVPQNIIATVPRTMSSKDDAAD